jgi:hypothetical protein
MKLSEIFKEALIEAKKEKPSAGLSKKQKSDVVKKAKAGKDIGKKGKGFEKIVAKAKKSGADDPEAVAASAMWKNVKRVKEEYQLPKHKILSQLVGPNFWLSKKPESSWDEKDHDLFERIWTMAKEEGKVPAGLSNMSENKDHEVSMAKSSLESIVKSAVDLARKLGDDERNIPGWIQDHITNAENFIDQAAQGFHELGGHDEEEGDDDEMEDGEDEIGMIEPVDEKKLTKAEKAKKEEIIKSMAKKGGGKEKMGPKQYAIATAQAIKSAE